MAKNEVRILCKVNKEESTHEYYEELYWILSVGTDENHGRKLVIITTSQTWYLLNKNQAYYHMS
jgi:hypothetical protein